MKKSFIRKIVINVVVFLVGILSYWVIKGFFFKNGPKVPLPPKETLQAK